MSEQQRLLQAADWFDRQAELTAAEQDEFLNWLDDADNLRAYQQLSQAMAQPLLDEALAKLPPIKQQRTVVSPAPTKALGKPATSVLLALAACLLLVVPLRLWFGDSAIGWLDSEVTSPTTVNIADSEQSLLVPQQLRSTIAVPNSVTLADGSQLHLNADTQVQLIASQQQRRVRLEQGQAFFDVAKDPQHPFVISVADTEIRVLGTEFDVDYLVSGALTVTVYQGHVQVTKADTYDLYAGQQLHITDGQPPQVHHLALETVPAWRTGWLNIDNRPLAEVLAGLQRYIDKPLRVESAALANTLISGRFALRQPQQTLQLLADAYALRVEQVDGEIRLTAR